MLPNVSTIFGKATFEDAAGAAGPLLRRGLRGPDRNEAGHVPPRVVDEVAPQAEVDYLGRARADGRGGSQLNATLFLKAQTR